MLPLSAPILPNSEPSSPMHLPGGRDIHLWKIALNDADNASEERVVAETMWQQLSADERLCAQRFVFARDKLRYVRAHSAMRAVLGMYAGHPAHLLRFERNAQGKPRLSGIGGLCFNLSHAQDCAMLAVGRAGEIGVDIEFRQRPTDMLLLAKRVFNGDENAQLEALPEARQTNAFFYGWTRKEATLKALGVGLSIEPLNVPTGIIPDRRWIELHDGARRNCIEVATFSTTEDSLVSLAAMDGFDEVRMFEFCDLRETDFHCTNRARSISGAPSKLKNAGEPRQCMSLPC